MGRLLRGVNPSQELYQLVLSPSYCTAPYSALHSVFSVVLYDVPLVLYVIGFGRNVSSRSRVIMSRLILRHPLNVTCAHGPYIASDGLGVHTLWHRSPSSMVSKDTFTGPPFCTGSVLPDGVLAALVAGHAALCKPFLSSLLTSLYCTASTCVPQ